MIEYEIDYLGNHQDFAQEVAELWVREWSGDFSEKKVLEQLEVNTKRYNTKKPPFVLVAYSGNELIGTSDLLLYELNNRPDLDVWVGGVFVKEKYRKNGIAKSLISAAVSKAKELNYNRIYLKTENAQGYYERLGWIHLEKTKNNFGRLTDVFYRDI